jgi:hypothetical protein
MHYDEFSTLQISTSMAAHDVSLRHHNTGKWKC